MKKSLIAVEHFKTMNCAQSVLVCFANELNLDELTALKIASGFGGGMARAETCGAVTGAYMVLGLKAQTEGKSIQEIKAEAKAAGFHLRVDLEQQTITTPDGTVYPFEVETFRKHCLLNGLDDIGLTMEKGAAIDAYEAKAATLRPWA